MTCLRKEDKIYGKIYGSNFFWFDTRSTNDIISELESIRITWEEKENCHRFLAEQLAV